MKTRLRMLAVATSLAFAPASFAAPCSGFTDVDDANIFCPSVDWLKNREITLGCSSASVFCPNDPVIRLSMAAFMNRLGRALIPDYDGGSGGATNLDLDAPLPAVCEVGLGLDPATFHRSARVVAVVSARIVGTAIFTVRIVQSTDAGVTWTPVNAVPASAGGTNRLANLRVMKGDIPLASNVGYRFALRIERAAGGGTGDLTEFNCNVRTIAEHRSGTSMPF